MQATADLHPTATVTNFGTHAMWSGVTNDNRAAWLQMRRKLATASEVAAIMGEDDYRSALDVYVEKRVPRQEERLALDDPRFLGSVVEQPILRAVAQYHGWQYRAGGALLISRRYPRIGATLDAEVERGDGVWCDLEGKTTELAGSWDEETGQLPTRVLIQAQTQLLVTGAEVAIVFAWLRRWKTATIEVYPNAALHAIIAEYVERFLELVDRETPPQPDGSQAAKRALERLYPTEDGAIVRLPPEAVAWTSELLALAEQRKELKRRETELGNLLRHTMGPATFGVLPEAVGGKRCWRWQHEGKTTRRLRPLKDAPPNAWRQLPDATPDRSLEQNLERSITAIRTKRRRNTR